jgi:hypothetical protein
MFAPRSLVPNLVRSEFAAVVLNHIHNELGSEEWLRFRSLCELAGPEADEPADRHCTPSRLVWKAMSEEGMSLRQTAQLWGDAMRLIGMADGRHVFFFNELGVYATACENRRRSLSIWLTHPAFPPGWASRAKDTALFPTL